MTAALLWKEWREQRWRGGLAALVMTTISASLVRAQIATTAESLVLSFGVLGLLLAIFLAMGSVATERADRTWAFLRARPVRRATLLRVKWGVGAANLLAALLLAGMAAHAAAWSRGLFEITPPSREVAAALVMWMPLGSSAWSVWHVVLLASAALLAWYTLLFFVLTRARDELHAGLGGVLLTLAMLAWLMQYGAARAGGGRTVGEVWQQVFWVSSLLNPLSPLAFMFVERWYYQMLAVVVACGLWLAAPLWIVGRLEPREVRW